MSVGWPWHAILNSWAAEVCHVFDVHVLYQVGSSVESKDWRDVDVVCLLSDEEFEKWFGHVNVAYSSRKWTSLCIAISLWGREITGLPIDFKVQQQSEANRRHPGRRNALGIFIDPAEYRKQLTNQNAEVDSEHADTE